MVRITWSSETLCASDSLSAMRARVHRLHCSHRVALDAGNLHQSADGIAGHAQIMLHRISAAAPPGRWFLPAPRSSPPAAIEQATPTSPWQPTSAPLIEAFSLYRMPIAADVRKYRTMPSWSASGENAHSSAPLRGPRRPPVCRRRDHAASGAFSSFTAMAYTVTQSSGASGSPSSRPLPWRAAVRPADARGVARSTPPGRFLPCNPAINTVAHRLPDPIDAIAYNSTAPGPHRAKPARIRSPA